MVWLIWKPIILLSGTCVYPNLVEGVRQESAGSYLINQTLLDCPVIGMPVGLNVEGWPMGMQIIGKNHADFAALQIPYAYEQAAHWVRKQLPPQLKAKPQVDCRGDGRPRPSSHAHGPRPCRPRPSGRERAGSPGSPITPMVGVSAPSRGSLHSSESRGALSSQRLRLMRWEVRQIAGPGSDDGALRPCHRKSGSIHDVFDV